MNLAPISHCSNITESALHNIVPKTIQRDQPAKGRGIPRERGVVVDDLSADRRSPQCVDVSEGATYCSGINQTEPTSSLTAFRGSIGDTIRDLPDHVYNIYMRYWGDVWL